MNHDVYICYDDKDQLTADAICHVLEENKIKCWLKTRDLGVSNMIDAVMDAIKQSKLMILIFSDYSKHSNYVNTEVDIAFTENIQILVFKIDNSKLDGGLEFFLNNKHWLDAYPDPEVKFENLIQDASELLGKPIRRPIIRKQNKRKPEPVKKEKIKEKPKVEKEKPPQPGGTSNVKTPIIIGIIALVLIGGVIAFMGLNGGDNTSSDIPSDMKIKINDFNVDDVSSQGYSWKYTYSVIGSISPVPSEGSNYKISADYYDASGNLLNTTETSFNDVEKISGGLLLGSLTSNSKEISRVEVNLMNKEDIVISHAESEL